MNRTPELRWKDLRHLFETWSRTYAQSPSHWRIDGKPVFSALNLTDFVQHYGLSTFRVMLLYARKVVRETIGIEPFLIGVVAQTNSYNAALVNQLPIDGTTGYALLPNWLDAPIQHYDMLVAQRVREWHEMQRHIRVPFFPVVSAGWDASVRGVRVPLLEASTGFPWTPIVTGVTPARFGQFLDHAIAFNLAMHPHANIVFIHAWNEWTEASAVEPSDRFSDAFLEEVRKRRIAYFL